MQKSRVGCAARGSMSAPFSRGTSRSRRCSRTASPRAAGMRGDRARSSGRPRNS